MDERRKSVDLLHMQSRVNYANRRRLILYRVENNYLCNLAANEPEYRVANIKRKINGIRCALDEMTAIRAALSLSRIVNSHLAREI